MASTRRGRILRWIEILGSRPPAAVRTLALVLVLMVGVGDWLSGPDLSLSFFYLLPVSMVSWHEGRRWGAGVAGLAAGLGLAADLLWQGHYASALVPWWNAGSRLAVFFVLVLILGALRGGLERQRHLALTDPLTGIMNRRAFYAAGEREIQRCRRYDRVLSAVFLDLDNFKRINDARGHHEGDTLLVAIAQTLGRTVRASDLLARVGGDEFAVLLAEAGPGDAEIFIERAVQDLTETMDRNDWPVTISAGVVTFLAPPGGMDEVVQLADEAMYRAKKRDVHSYHCEVSGG